ncbi:hypothetical protein [Mycobacterium stomatepiae]|uniref:hypothetical protein n=1 Tax=Mycobacterium stomatepiae TaxID=470076 RepID=UPI0013D0B497|nr:hypothetical protein [Mycobacterium stomatepiae]MCV7166145.1 hypothetical protein [Mycobacterium stomatepiae]
MHGLALLAALNGIAKQYLSEDIGIRCAFRTARKPQPTVVGLAGEYCAGFQIDPSSQAPCTSMIVGLGDSRFVRVPISSGWTSKFVTVPRRFAAQAAIVQRLDHHASEKLD